MGWAHRLLRASDGAVLLRGTLDLRGTLEAGVAT
jgi:hypothetical protein